jgi:hypothetical protein
MLFMTGSFQCQWNRKRKKAAKATQASGKPSSPAFSPLSGKGTKASVVDADSGLGWRSGHLATLPEYVHYKRFCALENPLDRKTQGNRMNAIGFAGPLHNAAAGYGKALICPLPP